MDGLDLHDTLTRRLDLASVIAAKARRAAEAGMAFVPVRELDLQQTNGPERFRRRIGVRWLCVNDLFAKHGLPEIVAPA